MGFHALRKIIVHDFYFIEGQLSQENCKQLALKLLTDPVTQSASWMEMPTPLSTPGPEPVILEVALRPGVTDPVAEQIVRAAHELGFDGVQRAATGQRFILNFNKAIDESAFANKLAKQLLANPVIHHWTIGDITPSFPQETESSGVVEIIPICNFSEDELLTLSKNRRAALDLAEMIAIQNYFIKEQRDPTDVEFETIAQTWSEHCGHKTFKAKVDVESPNGNYQIDSIIKTYLKSATDEINAPWVISAFVDNAGIIDFDDEFEVSFKVETHNHPSAIEPFGGANTGVGGVIRDVLGVSAKPIANTDVLCFGPQDINPDTLPDGVLHPRRIQSGVVAGVQDYGNKIGIPTVNGAILYDEGYTANPLVFCGCVGLAPKGKHVRTPHIGDHVIVLGGRTGRDGLRGATFSSMTMDAQTGEVAEASVQIGDPITEKGLIDVITRARDDIDIRWKDGAAVCVVLASKGYPEKVDTDKSVTFGELCENVICFHAGTKLENEKVFTSGGRVFGITSWAKTFNSAIRQAYANVHKISFDGVQYRNDIAYRALFPPERTDRETEKRISDGRAEYRTSKIISLPTDQLTYTINGLAMQVHNELGAGHAEKFYQRRFADLCKAADIPVEVEKRVEVWVDSKSIGYLKLDLWVDERLVVECKSFSHSLGVDEVGQVLTYLAATTSSVGMLYNFGRRRLELKRILKPKDVQDWQKHLYRFIHKSPGMVLPSLTQQGSSIPPIRFKAMNGKPLHVEIPSPSGSAIRLSASRQPSALPKSYASSGVDINAGNRAVDLMKDAVNLHTHLLY